MFRSLDIAKDLPSNIAVHGYRATPTIQEPPSFKQDRLKQIIIKRNNRSVIKLKDTEQQILAPSPISTTNIHSPEQSRVNNRYYSFNRES